MKKLIFKDETELQLVDASTASDLVAVVKDFAEIDKIKGEFTVDNMKLCDFDGEKIELIPVAIKAEAKMDGDIEVHFVTRVPSKEELLERKIEELQLALAELTK